MVLLGGLPVVVVNDLEHAVAAYVAGHVTAGLMLAREAGMFPMVTSVEVEDATHVVVRFADDVQVARSATISVTVP